MCLIALSYNSGFTSTAFCSVLRPVTDIYIYMGGNGVTNWNM